MALGSAAGTVCCEEPQPRPTDECSTCCGPAPPPCGCKTVYYIKSDPDRIIDSGSGRADGACGCDDVFCDCTANWTEWACKITQGEFKMCTPSVIEEDLVFWSEVLQKKFDCNSLSCVPGGCRVECPSVCPYTALDCGTQFCTQAQCQEGYCDCEKGDRWESGCGVNCPWYCQLIPALCKQTLKKSTPAIEIGCLPC